ncbi:MAG: hypothetical protein LBL27_00170 [Coriobacteriales bacterium]|jgi:hypothetical protein|nr:hypothetical protein [Coriobacteriales bacterium]
MGLFSRKKYDGEHNFPLWTKGGVCDVCGNSLSGKNAYTVPAKEFYASREYKEYNTKRTLDFLSSSQMLADLDATEAQRAAFIESQFEERAKTDKTPSAVCKSCVHMFE